MSRVNRNTKQKETLQAATHSFKQFFSAEGLAEKSDIPLATVYRFLATQTKEGALFSYRCDGKMIYSTKRRSHCHYICEESGKTIHFDIDNLDFIKNKVPGTIDSFQIEVRGTCHDCKGGQ